MNAEFWIKHWQNNEIAFHQHTVNVYLKKYFSYLNLKPGQCVFVPLCGKSLDMIWLAEQGCDVIGVEISEIAVEAFFKELNVTPKKYKQDQFICYEYEKIKIFCGDYFALTPSFIGTVNGVYDRAALIALPEPMRQNYVEQMAQLMPSHSNLLLVAMEHDGVNKTTPPFSVLEKEIQRLYAPYFKIELLLRDKMVPDEHLFNSLKLTQATKTIYHMTKL